MVGPGHIESGAVWNGISELLRTKTRILPCPGICGHGVHELAFTRNQDWFRQEPVSISRWWHWMIWEQGSKGGYKSFSCCETQKRKDLIYWPCEGESGLVAENTAVFRLVQTKKVKDEIRALFPAPAFGVVFHSFLPVFSPYPHPKPIFSVFLPNWERDSAQTAPLPGRHLWPLCPLLS